jgi:hypothetical protein
MEPGDALAESICPRCGRAGVPLLFGLVRDAGLAAAAKGREIVLAGCRVPSDHPPNWTCSRRHRWLDDSDAAGWDRRVDRFRSGER